MQLNINNIDIYAVMRLKFYHCHFGNINNIGIYAVKYK